MEKVQNVLLRDLDVKFPPNLLKLINDLAKQGIVRGIDTIACVDPNGHLIIRAVTRFPFIEELGIPKELVDSLGSFLFVLDNDAWRFKRTILN